MPQPQHLGVKRHMRMHGRWVGAEGESGQEGALQEDLAEVPEMEGTRLDGSEDHSGQLTGDRTTSPDRLPPAFNVQGSNFHCNI